MIDAQLNYFDMTVATIMLLSCLFAFFRGFVKEVLSLIGWIGAAAVTVYFFPAAAQSLQPHFAKPVIAAITATTGLYLLSLMGFAIINSVIIKILKSGSGMGMLDNILGLIFGALRGVLIISIAFFMLSLAMPEDDSPLWLKQAKTRPYVEQTTLMLVKIAPDYLQELANLQKKSGEQIQQSADEFNETVDNMEIPASNGDINEIEQKIGNEFGKGTKKETFEQLLKKLGNK